MGQGRSYLWAAYNVGCTRFADFLGQPERGVLEPTSTVAVFVDTNVLLHYPPFADIDWKEWLGAKASKLVICMPVIHELDEKKSDPRFRERPPSAVCAWTASPCPRESTRRAESLVRSRAAGDHRIPPRGREGGLSEISADFKRRGVESRLRQIAASRLRRPCWDRTKNGREAHDERQGEGPMRNRCSIVLIVISAVFGLAAASASAQTQLIGHLPGCGGFSLAKFGDWDGDTIPDIVRSCAGAQVLLVSGATGQTLVGLTLPPNSSSYYVHGAIPDLDGDGRPEVVVGDLGGTPAPGPFGLYLTAGWIAAYSFLTPSVPLWQRGPSPQAYFALGYRAFATLGDLNGDGIPDIAAGYSGGGPSCPTFSAPIPIYAYAGLLEIVSGANGTLIRSHASQPGEYWPLAAAAPSDISGDGIADYVSAGAGRPPPGFSSCGPTGPPPVQAYVSRVEAFSGATGSLLWQITAVPMSGILVTAIGDVDGDSDPDILYRANPATGGSEAIIDATSGSILTQTAGAALIILGGPVGDVNGNGGADFATGIAGGTVVRTGLAGTSLYTLTGMTAMPVPLWDMNGDGRVEYAFSNDQSAQYPPGYSDWSILSLGSTATTASVAGFGTGCGPGGAVPGLVFSGPPYFGWMRSLGYVNGLPGGTGYVFFGAPGPGLGIGGGCTVYIDLAQPFSLAWSSVLDAGGSAFTTIVVPQLAGFAGTTVRLQGAHVDAGALALTGALDLLFGF
jgi:hypothetical protein